VAGVAGRSLTAVLALAVVASLLTVTALPHRAVAAPAKAKPACPASRPDEAAALVTARLCGGRVLVSGDESETRQVYAMPDGSLQSTTAIAPVRVQQNGKWVPVDVTLRRNPDGSVSPAALPGDVRLSGPVGAGEHVLAGIGEGNARVSMGWSGALPAPVLSGDTATYPDVLPGIDLKVQVTRTGFEQFVVVKDRAAVARASNLNLPVTSPSAASYARDAGGNVTLRDKAGRAVAVAAAPEMWDATTVPEAGGPSRRVRLGTSVAKRTARAGLAAGVDMTLRPDASWLNDPARVFPVTLDPTVSPVSDVSDTYVMTGDTVDRSGANDLELGAGSGQVARTLINWDTSAFVHSHINSATVYFWNWYSASCTPDSWDIWTTDLRAAGTVWTNQPTWRFKEASTTSTAGFSSSCDDDWVNISGTSFFQRAADGGHTLAGMGVRATNESDANSWKQFRSANYSVKDLVPYATVDYTPQVAVAGESTTPSSSCVTGAGRPYLGSATPTLQAQLTGTAASVSATFEWWAVGGTAAIGSATDGPKSSGSTFTATVPAGAFSNGSSYMWRVRGTNGTVTSPWSGWCEFTVDTTEPATAPGVSSPTWPANVWTGGTPSYTFATAPQTYVNGTTTLPVTGDGGGATVSLPFTFNLFGKPYTSMWVGSDGHLITSDNAKIMPFETDLTVDASASVRSLTSGTSPNRQWVVDWHNVYRNAEPTERFNFEAILSENGTITFNYGSLDTPGSQGQTASVGLTDTVGFHVWYSTQAPNLDSGIAVIFTPNATPAADYTISTASRAYTPATTVSSLTGDDETATMTLPFPVSLYGQHYSTAWVSTNGWLTFKDPTQAPNGGIDVFSDDLIIDASSAIRTSTTGTAPNRQFILEWHNVALDYNFSERFDAEVIFTEGSGDIVTDYENLDNNDEKGANAFIGVEDPNGALDSVFSDHQPLLANNTAITFHPVSSVPFAEANTAANFTFTPAGVTDVASYQYGFDTNPPTTVVNAPTLGGSATVSITPTTDGPHTVYVRSQDRAGNQSPITSYVINVGAGGLTSPKPGDISAGIVALTPVSGPYANGVTYQWRRADTDDWQDIPVSDVTIANGGGTINDWPYWSYPNPQPTLNWNVASTVNAAEAGPDALDGPLQVRVEFAGNATLSTTPIKFTLDRNQASAASSDVGPGSVNLVTGNLTLSDTDVSVDSYGSDLTVTRAYNTRQATSTDAANMFGPGWVSGVAVEDADAPYTNLTVTGSLVQVGMPDGSTIGFTATTATSSGKTFEADDEDEDLQLTYTASGDSYTLKDLDGNVVTFTHVSGAASNTYNPTAVTTPGSNQTTTQAWQKVTVGGVDVVRPTQLLAPVPAGVTCTTLVKGCRALTFTYASTTTATGTASNQWGDYAGRVSQISFTAWDPDASPAAMRTIVMARYQYDNAGRLRAQWDPRLDYTDLNGTHHLADTYDYNADGIVSTITPAGGQPPWQLSYTTVPGDAGKGRLAQVTRSALSAGTANTTIVYQVPTTGTGAPYDLSGTQTARWGQSAPPVAATAVYPPTQVPDGNQAGGTLPSSYERATLTYTDANGRAVNTVTPGGYTTATWYDQYGNTIQSLTAANRQRALNASTTDTPAQEAAIAYRESTVNLYSPDGQELRETFGPEHDIALTNGSVVRGRDHTVNTYDQGAPNTGGPFHLLTTTVTSASYTSPAGALTGTDARTTTTGYDWTLRQPIISTVDPSGLALATRTTYDATTGLVTSTTAPAGGTTTNTPATTQTVYYRAGTGSGYTECDSHPEWANLTCRTQAGGQAATGPELPVTVTTYDVYNQPRVKTEKTSAGTLRTTTTSYDAAGRQSTVAITGATGTGVALPVQRHLYDQATGQLTHVQSLNSGGTVTADLVTGYDTLGRTTSYTDADNNTSATTYDIAGNTATTNDGKATRTYTYDGGTERRGLATQVVDGQAGTFAGGVYDPDGKLTTETWPNGIVVTHTYDETGTESGIAYTQPGCGQTDCTLYREQIHQSAQDQDADRTSTLSAQRYGYDADGRLTTVNDTVNGACTTRGYTFNSATDRTGLSTYDPATDGSCQTTTAAASTTWTYDTADRTNTSGYVYDSLGRTTTVPAADTQNPGSGNLTATYDVNDLVAIMSQGGITNTYTLDADAQRIRSWSVNDGATITTKSNHYDSTDDSPAWTDEGDGTWTRPVDGLDGMVDIITPSDNDWQIVNLHGDCVAAIHDTDAGLSATTEADEYGVLRDSSDVGRARYGWLGAKQRAADNPDGIILMGLRLYNPFSGRFLSVDPVPGGSANRYDYVFGDPINKLDLDGNCWGCRWVKRHIVKHWRGIAQVALWSAAGIAGAACIAATAGVCGGVVAGYLIAGGLGAAAGAGSYALSGGKHTKRGYASAAAWGAAANVGSIYLGRVVGRASAGLRFRGSFTSIVRRVFTRGRYWRL
jgi:RHS repeat-associated protein